MKRALLDTNVLVLLLLGGARPTEIGRNKRIKNFSLDDLNALLKLVTEFDEIVTLPYIIAETSNLLGIGKSAHEDVSLAFKRFLSLAKELKVVSGELVEDPLLMRLGVTDTAIARMRSNRTEIVTVDYQLYGIVQRLGLRAINLRHLTDLNSGGANA